MQFSHGRVFSDSRNVQKRATKSDTSGHCLRCSAGCLLEGKGLNGFCRCCGRQQLSCSSPTATKARCKLQPVLFYNAQVGCKPPQQKLHHEKGRSLRRESELNVVACRRQLNCCFRCSAARAQRLPWNVASCNQFFSILYRLGVKCHTKEAFCFVLDEKGEITSLN